MREEAQLVAEAEETALQALVDRDLAGTFAPADLGVSPEALALVRSPPLCTHDAAAVAACSLPVLPLACGTAAGVGSSC